MKTKGKISDLAYAAMLVAVFVSIHFIFPANNRAIQSIMGIITPIPIAIYCVSGNIRKNIAIGITGLLLAFLFFEPIMVISFVIPNLIFGIVLGCMLKTNLSWYKMLLLISLCIGFNIYEIYLNYLITGLNFIELNIVSIKTSIEITKEYFENVNEKILFDLNIVLLPLILIIGGTLKTILTCYLTKSIIERLSGKKVEHKELEYSYSNSIVVEIVMLSICGITIVIWGLLLLNILSYTFFYSVLLDIMLLVVLAYYGIIHKKMTSKFKDKKIKYICISLLYMSLFWIISPIVAITKIIKFRRLK